MLFGSVILMLTLAGRVVQEPTRFAAKLPQRVSAHVCGQPALPSTVLSAVEGAIQLHVHAAPGVNYDYTLPACPPLFPHQHALISVKVLATAPSRIQASGAVTVEVLNDGSTIGRERLLWFCNKPENLQTSGPLFDGTLTAGQAIRLLYHHQNRGTQPLYMRIELVNASDKPGRVWIIPGDGRPNRDPVWSGLKAARKFLPALLTGSGEAIDLLPQSAVPIGFRRLVMGDTASGLCTLKLASGGPDTVEVRAEATLPIRLRGEWTQATLDPAPWHWVRPHPIYNPVAADYQITPLIYLHPFVEASVRVQIGGPPTTVKFGVEGIPRQGGGRGLNGNYGVLHTFDVSLVNPTSRTGHVEFWVDATTNYTAAVFAFPSRVIWLHPLQRHTSKLLISVSLAPGEHRAFKLRTIPVSGGWYPATLRVKPVPIP